jgi:tetratricopeptide (TPR) repeat protein
MNSFFKLLSKLVFVATLLTAGLAMAQSEPSMNQIYSAAQAGKLDEAQVMVQQVLVSHPKSAKAYFVQAELYSRQGRLDRARESLSTAEKYAPGLPFAKPEAVQTLRAQLTARTQIQSKAAPDTGLSAVQARSQSPTNWALPLLLAGGVMVAGYFFFRRRNPEPYAQQQVAVNPNGLNGPQTFGTGGGTMQPAYPQPGYAQGFPQQAGTGMGGRIMGGVATGLAVGAGVMAAEAIGRNLMGGHNSTPVQPDRLNNNYEPIATNSDMGGDNFGINDTSWEDGSSADAGGGSDWDN